MNAKAHVFEDTERPPAAGHARTLKLLERRDYVYDKQHDPLAYYFLPLIGRMYRRRVELCLAECRGGGLVLEVGCGCGPTFLNLAELYDNIYGLDLTAPVQQVAEVFRARHIETNLRNGNVLDMPYADESFDTVLLISILEHLRPEDLRRAFAEIRRVLKPGGQVVYGVPIERPLMVFLFGIMGCRIREHHFSTEKDVHRAAAAALRQVRLSTMKGTPALVGAVYQIGHFVK